MLFAKTNQDRSTSKCKGSIISLLKFIIILCLRVSVKKNKLNSMTVPVLPSLDPSLIFPFHLLPSPVHPAGFSSISSQASMPFLSCHRTTKNISIDWAIKHSVNRCRGGDNLCLRCYIIITLWYGKHLLQLNMGVRNSKLAIEPGISLDIIKCMLHVYYIYTYI